ncbi:MAG: hypothetical protein RJA70_1872 [Pseudomonadota bacterium]|jgi:hypothetical protein
MLSRSLAYASGAIPPGQGMIEAVRRLGLGDPSWLIAYAPEDAPLDAFVDAVRRCYPKATVCGCTSYQGTFSQDGFSRKIVVLAADAAEEIRLVTSLRDCGPNDAREVARGACEELMGQMGRAPDMLFLYATPGSEERILEGISDYFGPLPVFGGSAGDDHIAGRWRVFSESGTSQAGFVLGAVSSPRSVRGGFLGGYLPTEHSGQVTRASGRVVYEIDRQPAARVYNTWTQGAIGAQVEHGGSVLSETTLFPLGKNVSHSGAMPQRLLAHPSAVVGSSGAIRLFTEFQTGDTITLMTSSPRSLVQRIERVVERTRSGVSGELRGGLFLYCGGTLSVTLDLADEIPSSLRRLCPNVPFVGVATLGEQGAFFPRGGNYHGNLMCVAVLFF